MTAERDVERVLERWLVDGVDEMPDSVYLTILDRVEHQPQKRAWRGSLRDSTVNGYLKPLLAIAAVVFIVVAGVRLVAAPSVPGVGGIATPSPSPTASVAPSPTSPPPDLPNSRLEHRDYVARAFPGDPMAFTITAPAGWTGYEEFFLGGPNGSSAPSGIGISFNHDPQVVTDPCDASLHSPSPGSTSPSVDDLVAALSAREDLGVSGVTDTVLAGYEGKRLDLQLPTDLACGNHYVFAEPKGLYANGPANRWRVWLLEVAGSTAVVVLLDYAATPVEDRAAAQTALDSLRITP